MPQMATVTIKNGASTPADVSFAPGGINNGVSRWTAGNGSVALRPKLDFSQRNPVNGNGVFEQKIHVVLPKGDTPAGATVEQVDHINMVEIRIRVHELSSEQEVKDLRAFAANLLGQADFKAAIEKIEPFY